ncbi:F-box/LRR-repeat protein 4-like isoform X4 [Dreissena polymorpha]|uniref:F-box/LRR-repeat protein 4-like isoform X3 n=1 Tax=Dreissena polymorpha TaxID=45954 RepID=UPI002264B25E|nr:F-box/LRR-repeat protein 4-like isoform X3 [Dreissena polymorpha]XP_052223755.1 F-box/LRR-repeat protein 4-like isoform X4 [Dreissena polymorpha]
MSSQLKDLVATEVRDFSSQYGNEVSISYTASNLAGPCRIYPKYGDYTQSCVFRTYGDWWHRAPSAREGFRRTPPDFCSQDYIELAFPEKIYPLEVRIYETYNPGCVVRILACDYDGETDVDTGLCRCRWKTLWSGSPSRVAPVARVFSPPLAPCPFPTDLLRIEVCHDMCDYYTNLDAVYVRGTSMCDYYTNLDTVIVKRTSDPPLDVTTATNNCQSLPPADSEPTQSDSGLFSLLPDEVIQLILSLLDLLSLCCVAQTCRLLYQHSYDSLQYTELNLQPFWTQIDDCALKSLLGRSHFLQRFNLSWCHGNLLTETAFTMFMEGCGTSLRCLYLASCNFVSHDSLSSISEYCPNLAELDLSSCTHIDQERFDALARLTKLEYLNLYRTHIEQEAITSIIRSCLKLQHLNLGSANCIQSYDDVLYELGTHSKQLVSLDLWRSRTVTDEGLKHLSLGCPDLQEIDLGWCPGIKSQSGSIQTLVVRCYKLRKLFLTANRTVCDEDLIAIATHSRDLEQLDILGTLQVSGTVATRLLQSCSKLVFFDVSFCSGISDVMLYSWAQMFPRVSVKKSFQQ